MSDFLVRLLTSHRVLVGTLAALCDVVVLFGVDVPKDLAEKLAELITILATTYIAGKSWSDYGAAVHKPPGVDHKGRTSVV